MRLVGRLARTTEFYPDLMFICPGVQVFAGELRAIVHMQQARQLSLSTQSLKIRVDSIAREGHIDLQSGAAIGSVRKVSHIPKMEVAPEIG